jgi:hypothetical protein
MYLGTIIPNPESEHLRVLARAIWVTAMQGFREGTQLFHLSILNHDTKSEMQP